MPSRRAILQRLGLGFTGALAGCATLGEKHARVVVVGGGFAGASCARAIKQGAPQIHVTLVEPNSTYTACPFSNLVIATDRPLSAQQFTYAGVVQSGVDVVHRNAVGVDAERRIVTLEDRTDLRYDRVVLAPGIAIDWQALPGYDRTASVLMPHAWQAGEQTLLLKKQLRAMPDGGTVAIVAPDNPFRCPPGPYERASLIAHYLKMHKPRSKVLMLDAKDRFSKQGLFIDAWQQRYGDMVSWQGRSDGASVTRVDAAARRLHTDFDSLQPDVANVIPPQTAGRIAQTAGAADASGWCPIDATTFQSMLLPDVHVIGDAAIANAMPKSAFAANAQAKYCAVQVVRSLRGLSPLASTLVNTCYSLVQPDYAISVAGVYRPVADTWRSVKGAGGTSPKGADDTVRAREAAYAKAWYDTLTAQVFGG